MPMANNNNNNNDNNNHVKNMTMAMTLRLANDADVPDSIDCDRIFTINKRRGLPKMKMKKKKIL